MAGIQRGRNMKLFRFSLNASTFNGASNKANNRAARKGTLGISITAARRMDLPRNAARQRARL